MTDEFKLERVKQVCAGCAREFQPNDALFSCIFRTEEQFQRRDYCRDCFVRRAEEPFSYWETRFPKREKPKLDDIEKVQRFFTNLLQKNPEGPNIPKIRFFTALVLMRKKRLKLLGTRMEQGQTVMRLEKTWDGESVDVADPGITETELGEVRAEMERLFDAELAS